MADHTHVPAFPDGEDDDDDDGEENDDETEEEETEEEEEEEEEEEGEEANDQDYFPPPQPVLARRVSQRTSRNVAPRIDLSDEQEEEQQEGASFRQVTESAAENGERRAGGGGRGEASASLSASAPAPASSSNGREIERSTVSGDLDRLESEGSCCPICMEPCSSEDSHQISCLPCGHVYGLSCIEKWVKQRRNNARCPQCSRKCREKDIIKLYISRILVTDYDQQKKVLSLLSENEFLKMKIANLHKKISQLKDERMSQEETAKHSDIVSSGRVQRQPSGFLSWTGDSQGQTLPGLFVGSHFGSQRSSSCRIVLEDELVVDGARIFDMDVSNKILILARRISGMGGTHVLTKISLMYPYDNENISLPSTTKAVKDLHVSPWSNRHALFASLGKKLSVLSMESNNIVISYTLPAPAWSCSWDGNSPHHLYAGLQNGMVLVFDMRQTVGPVESIIGITCRPVHTIHSLVHNFDLAFGVKTLLSASATGPCIWRTIGEGVRPFPVREVENGGVCISLAYCPSSDDIVASFRPEVQNSVEVIGSQLPLSSPATVTGRGVRGSHVVIKGVGNMCYQKLGSTSAIVNEFRMSKSAIVNMENCNPLFAYGDEVSRGLSLSDLPSLRVIQNLKPLEHPILDVKYASSPGFSLLGCVSEDRLQLFSVKPPS